MGQLSCVLVCVTVQKECARLIREGQPAAREAGATLHVLHVSEGKNPLGNPDAAEALDFLFSLAHEADGEMNILYERDVSAAIARYAAAHDARTLILGPDHSGIEAKLKALLPEQIQLRVLAEPPSASARP